jgi:hypothetical protein
VRLNAVAIVAQVKDVPDLQARRMLAAENVQREDLSPLAWVEAIVPMVDADRFARADGLTLGDIPLARVNTGLMTLDSDRRHGTDGGTSTCTGAAEHIVLALPNPRTRQSWSRSWRPTARLVGTAPTPPTSCARSSPA